MMAAKKEFDVYSRYYFNSENEEDSRVGRWQFMGTTWAVSESKAINNVRFRSIGNVSQYSPIAVSGHWDNGLEWKAKQTGGQA